MYTGYHSVIASMSAERGFEVIKIYTEAIDAEKFKDYLERLRKKLAQLPLALYMDQLSVHKSKDVRPSYERLDVTPIFNVSYSPQFNAIESAFSKVKRIFNERRLHHLVNKKDFDVKKEIRDAFKMVTVDHCAACVRKSMFLLRRSANTE